MSIILRKLLKATTANIIIRHNDTQVLLVSCRKLTVVPSLYDGEKDPAPTFFSSNVQVLLKRLTRPDYTKVFRKTTNRGLLVLKTPKYKFLTNEELEAELANAKVKAEKLLQMPPVVKIHEPINDKLSEDPALIGYDKSKYLFTDISFGVDNAHRIIVERWGSQYVLIKEECNDCHSTKSDERCHLLDVPENRIFKQPTLDSSTPSLPTLLPDLTTGSKGGFFLPTLLPTLAVVRDPEGVLRSCDHDTRKKLNQVYFPIKGRKLREPLMFSDLEKLHSLLEREEYEFILNRACVQYEPDEPKYQQVTSITYQHVDSERKYELLRSTRHFGPLAFYLAWHESLDNLMLELLQTGAIREAVLLMSLQQVIKGNVVDHALAQELTEKILQTPVQLTRPEMLSDDDIELDTKCIDCVTKYIVNNSCMKSQQELALQGFREHFQHSVELSRGLRKAHGNA